MEKRSVKCIKDIHDNYCRIINMKIKIWKMAENMHNEKSEYRTFIRYSKTIKCTESEK